VTDNGSRQHTRGFSTAVEDAKAAATVLAIEAESALGRRTARFLGVLGIFAIAVVMLLIVLDWYIDPSKPGERKDLILTLAQILGGAALLSGLYFTWRTVQVNREGQITERFTRAIDQLGETDDKGRKKLEIRLGGIYALERIARDSPERDYSTVMEVLMAYVRENAPWPPKSAKPPEEGSVSDSKSNDVSEQHKDAEPDAEPTPTKPPTDIQAILEVFKRREDDRVPEKHRVHVDLQGTDLQGANLAEANLKGAILRRARLEGADLYHAHLEEALLRDSHLEEAELSGANLEGAHLVRANLKGAYLWATNLKNANLIDANLEGAAFLGANLEGAYLSGANLDKAYLLPEQIEWTIGDEKTKLPEQLVDSRPPAWSKTLEEQVRIINEHLKQVPTNE
jgi:hypothetical protein